MRARFRAWVGVRLRVRLRLRLRLRSSGVPPAPSLAR